MQDHNLYNQEAEEELIGMLIQNNTRIDSISFFREEFLYYDYHKEIFKTIKHLVDKNITADIINILSALKNKELFNGKEEYILIRISRTLSCSTPRCRAEFLYSLYLKRQMVQIGQEMVENSSSCSFIDICNEIEKTEEKIYSLKENKHILKVSDTQSLVDSVLNDFHSVIFDQKYDNGIKTGFSDIDDLIGSFKKGDMIVLGGVTSCGKTAYSLGLAYNMAKNSNGVLFCSLEMTDKQLMTRMVSIHNGINNKSFDTGTHIGGNRHLVKYTKEEYEQIKHKTQEIANMPLYIQDGKGLTISDIRSIGRQMKKKNIDVIIIDYIQLIKSTNNDKYKTDAGRMSEIAHGLKALAKELDVVIIILSQLSRSVESRDDHRPMLSDLKESGAIAEAADIVMLLYREAYYLERKKPEYPEKTRLRNNGESIDSYSIMQKEYTTKIAKYNEWKEKFDAVKNKAEINIAKNRKGAIGIVNLYFDQNKTKFSNILKNNLVVKEDFVNIQRSDHVDITCEF